MIEPDDPPARVDVLCNACGFKALEDVDEFVLQHAWNPKFIPGPGDAAVLIAPTLLDARPEKLLQARKMKCEGCGAAIYVAPSSDWLLDLKKRIES